MEAFNEGYPRLAAYMASDGNFTLYHNFGYLHSRLLLSKHFKLRELEEDLQMIDSLEVQSGDEVFLRCNPKSNEQQSKFKLRRQKIFERVENELLRYGK